MKRSRSTFSIVVVLILLVGVWQGYIWWKHIPPYVLPTPARTLQEFRDNFWLLLRYAKVTAEGAALGLAASLVLALALGLVIHRWPLAQHVILTWAVVVRTVPIVGIAPIVTLITGRGFLTSVLCVVVITVFSLLLSVVQGFTAIPHEIAELGALYATPFPRRVRITLLPAAMASLLHGLRVTAPLAVLGALLAEFLDGFKGIGRLMVVSQANQEVELLMAACMTAVVLSLLSFALVEVAGAFADRRGYGE
jgi:ABC-type nitrate/sulfonate/bicarbonate transport system permease component